MTGISYTPYAEKQAFRQPLKGSLVMKKTRKALTAMPLVILLLALPAASGAQIMGVLTLERLCTLDTWGTGARAWGMGGAFTSVSDDALGLIYNPAGIVRSSGNEVSFGMHQLWQDIDENYDGSLSGTRGSYTAFGHVAVLVPYETYTTDLKFGFGIFRVGSSNLEYLKDASRPDLGGNLRNIFLQTGNIYHYKFSVAGNITKEISVGGSFVIWDESPGFTEEISFAGAGDSSYAWIDDVTADLDGVSFEFGILARLSTFLHAGLVFTTPSWITYQGSGSEYYDGTYQDGSGWTTDPYPFYSEEKFTLPMNFRFGASFQAEDLIVALDISWADYRQTEYNDRKIYYENDPTIDIMRQVWSYRAGAEMTIPGTSLSFRAGYMYLPLPFKGIDELTYIEEQGDEFWLSTEWDFTEVKEERHYYTAGIGYIFADLLVVDLAVSRGSFERSTQWLSEKKVTTEFVASAAYRF
jgi:long-subunit fatty acid transport protein